jgi:hypothetical protein
MIIAAFAQSAATKTSTTEAICINEIGSTVETLPTACQPPLRQPRLYVIDGFRTKYMNPPGPFEAYRQ